MKPLASILLDELRATLNLPPPPKRVLIVEDDANFATVMMESLNEGGCAVEVADTPDKAVAMVSATIPFTRIFLDLKFEGEQTGVFALKRIRQMFPTMPITVLSGFVSDEFEKVARDDYHIDVRRKPVDVAELQAMVAATV